MDQAMKIPFKVSTTTSNFMIGVTAAASAGLYLGRGYIAPGITMPVMLGVLAGSMIGARLLVKAKVKALRPSRKSGQKVLAASANARAEQADVDYLREEGHDDRRDHAHGHGDPEPAAADRAGRRACPRDARPHIMGDRPGDEDQQARGGRQECGEGAGGGDRARRVHRARPRRLREPQHDRVGRAGDIQLRRQGSPSAP